MITVCGSDCSTCAAYIKDCRCTNTEGCYGCSETKGHVCWTKMEFWTKVEGDKPCPIYNCVVNEKKYKNCGECSDLPCEMYKSLKDPSMTDEAHLASVDRRVKNLKK